ncbi:MAG: cystathionine gamma-synthase [Actinomycetota bacterium]|nr:cystathionine gamma-synthase [Acidimicrobiales bacterium]MEC9316451.1 cystathionine gamma-synthase [Actinomycetota bacterium]MED5552437.1 cystathionine gamma-synthase [Actinomycetota bacterium]MEE3188177.1 cystathionine gamma-synthase [Actinomycetota bacterium]|tara:strand:+ start:1493 stop:2683 length:1191 start_codon:yes stop_codon:yes gene_type:complete
MMGGDPLLSGFEDPEEYGFETRAIRAGQPHDQRTGGVVTPIAMSTTFAQEAPGSPRHGYEYSRTGNPTRHAYEACVASLEGAKYGFAFASGLSAEDALLRQLNPGSQILLGNDAYGGTFRLIDKVHGKNAGVGNAAVDLTEPDRIKEVWNPDCRMVWLETPTNPMLSVFDIRTISDVVHELGGLLVVDNTFATPYLQQPLALGADAVVHSATKYIGGHSDVVGGFVATNHDALAEDLVFLQNAVGAIPSPFDCYLALRGVKTLAVRMDRHCENAKSIVSVLSEHPAVTQVLYPGLEDHPGHEVASQQMRDFGGMVSFRLAGGQAAAERVVTNTRVFTLAESLGAVESLIEHPGVMTHLSVAGSALEVPEDLVRISVGIESTDDLVNDLVQALDQAG